MIFQLIPIVIAFRSIFIAEFACNFLYFQLFSLSTFSRKISINEKISFVARGTARSERQQQARSTSRAAYETQGIVYACARTGGPVWLEFDGYIEWLKISVIIVEYTNQWLNSAIHNLLKLLNEVFCSCPARNIMSFWNFSHCCIWTFKF